MTEPLTPPECDLQDFPFMPLHVARLRDSDLASEAKPEACWYAVLLWAASWHQIPAASLPDNDAVLAKLIGLGRDVKTFRKHKAEAMRGFVKCSDGRLYHPIVAEQAMNSWERKLQQRWRTECARIKKANQRNETNLPTPSYEEWLSSGTASNCPEDVPGDNAKCPSGQSVQETGTGTGISISEAKASADPLMTGDHDRDCWTCAKSLLRDQGGMTDDAAGRFFGKLLSEHRLAARDLFPSVVSALTNGTRDPKAYLVKAATGVSARAARPSDQRRVGFV